MKEAVHIPTLQTEAIYLVKEVYVNPMERKWKFKDREKGEGNSRCILFM